MKKFETLLDNLYDWIDFIFIFVVTVLTLMLAFTDITLTERSQSMLLLLIAGTTTLNSYYLRTKKTNYNFRIKVDETGMKVEEKKTK